MKRGNEEAANPMPLPEERERFREVWELDELVRGLRDKVEKGADAVSIARSIAPFFVDSIARVSALSRELDVILFNQVCVEDQPFYEKIQRFSSILRLQAQLLKIFLEAVDGLLLCFGGKGVLGAQAIGEWAARQRAGSTDPAQNELLARLMNTVIKRSAEAAKNQ